MTDLAEHLHVRITAAESLRLDEAVAKESEETNRNVTRSDLVREALDKFLWEAE